MATQPDTEDVQDDDILELEEGQIIEDEPPVDEPEEPEEVGFADEQEATPAAENDLVKHLRQQIRDRDRKLAETAKAAPAEPEVVVGPRPKLWDDGVDGDEERFEAALDAWDERKVQADKQAAKREQAQRAQEEQWNKVTQDYAAKKSALRYPDVQEAEQTALDTLSPTAQALIARHADNSALFMYAVGKSPAKLAELARIDAEGDPFAVVKAVTKMEGTLTTKRSAVRPPNPDTPVRGRPIAAGSPDKVLEKLEKEARATGDRSKLIAHKTAMREKTK